jgi:tRNA A-37 threonylcarbamoyl transferase component Bud32
MRAEIEARPPVRTDAAALFGARPDGFLRQCAGRETFRWRTGVDPESPVVIVKRMPGRGGRREHDNLETLRAEGFPVPEPIAWAQEGARVPFGGPVRSLVVMEAIDHEETLRDRLGAAGARERASWSHELLGLVARLHEVGWHHRDLYLQHFLLLRRTDPTRRLVLIDVGRARRDPFARKRWYVKDLAALAHSCPANVGVRERLEFLSRYLDLRGIHGRLRRSAWMRAVVRKAARIARHVPRDERARMPVDGARRNA